MILPNQIFSFSWKHIDSPKAIIDNYFTSSQEMDRKFGDIMQFVNNGYALMIINYKKDPEGFVRYSKIAVTSLCSMGGIKLLNLRKRPDGMDKKSFPSGHVTGAFIPVGFLYYNYGLQYAILPCVFGLAVAYSRIEAKRHFVTDTLAGAALSILVSKFLTSPVINNGKLTIIPEISSSNASLNINCRF